MWNLAGTGLPLLLGVVTIPYLIKHIGVEAFGILTLIWSLIGYFSLFDFGLGRALTQRVAASLVSENTRNVPHVVKSGLVFMAYTGIAGGILLALLAYPLGSDWLNVSQPLQATTIGSLFVAALGIPLATVTSGLRGVLEAYEDFKTVNLLRIVLGIANFGLPALSFVLLGPSLVYMVAMLIAARLVVLLAYGALAHRRMPESWLKSTAQANDVKDLLSFGVWMTVSNIISPLMVTADRFVIAAVLGASAVAYYTVPFEMLVRVLVIPSALTSALFPKLASTLKTNPAIARMLYWRSMKLMSLTLLGISLAICLASYWGLALWLNADFASRSWLIVCILSVGILFNGIALVPFSAIQAAGDAKTTAHLHVFEFIIYVPVLLIALDVFGLLGAALAWVFRVGLDLVLLLWRGKRFFG
ncbi:MAG TPA: flippase [Eoetvoesiella sp.]|uniref:flippase n=1 Tax=Eoetvoesiella sp. TaxID=1966355 RepID=UPI002B9A546B|nr:flippase [Eoetvoesiella sp.]HWK61387.1 flippase [Eoetvoesiella sp.]